MTLFGADVKEQSVKSEIFSDFRSSFWVFKI